MRSRKLQALDFIKRYFAQWGGSPSLEEIGSHLGVSRQRASALVHQLSAEQQIRQVAGKRRGIELIDEKETLSEAEALLALARKGWVITEAQSVRGEPSLTKNRLRWLPYLDHSPE